MKIQAMLWAAAGLCAALAAFSGLAERRRARRSDLDRAGWVPWNLLQILAFLLLMVCAGLALQT